MLPDTTLPEALFDAATLTGASVSSDPLNVTSAAYVGLTLDYTQGDGGTKVIVVPEIRLDGSSTWTPVTAQNSAAADGGVVLIELVEIKYSINLTGKRNVLVPVFDAQAFRVSVYELGAAPFGSITIHAVRVNGVK